jgi:hypothetical protein
LDIKQPLFTRTTRVTETDEGIQQANISVYLYDDIDVAYLYFKDFMSDEEWDKQIETGEGFYEVQGNGYTNTLFLETRKV